MTKNKIIAIGIIFGLARVLIGFTVPPEHLGLNVLTLVSVYKDFAHIFIGFVFSVWYFERHQWAWRLFWALNFVEVATAIGSRV